MALAIVIFSIITMWKIFEKAGEPGWASIIPIYNTYIEFEIAFGSGISCNSGNYAMYQISSGIW